MGNVSSAEDNEERNVDGREVLASSSEAIALAGPRLSSARERQLSEEYVARIAPKWTSDAPEYQTASVDSKPNKIKRKLRPAEITHIIRTKQRAKYRFGRTPLLSRKEREAKGAKDPGGKSTR